MSYIDVPAKVLECFIKDQNGEGAWPFDDGSDDPFWQFGSSPRDYRWRVTIEVNAQSHSSHKTRVARTYNGMDVKVGDYVSSLDGTAVKIICIERKSDLEVVCIVEDVFRYNTFRDASGLGGGIFAVPGNAIIFEVNESGFPVVDPLPASGVGPMFYANLMSRFQNLEKLSNFIVHKPNHGFQIGHLVSADAATNSFVLTDDDHPYLIGTVSFINGPHHFTVNPIQKIVDDIDYLGGEVSDILYADPDLAGQLTTEPGTNPVMIKLREYTPTVVRSTVKDATTPVSDVITINGVNVTVGGSGDIPSLVIAINQTNTQHGVNASVVSAPTTAETKTSLLHAAYGEALLRKPPTGLAQARINGQLVSFITTTHGRHRYGDNTLVTAADMATDINAAAIPNLVASATGTSLLLRHLLGAGITIENVSGDADGHPFAGPASASGLPLASIAPAGSYIKMEADDARPINLANKTGYPLEAFGLYSVENGTKAAAIYIEQGIRKASNYVVPDVASRDALQAILGDQAYVINKGDGEWGLYLYSGGSWIIISSAEAAKVDSDTYTATLSYGQPMTVLGRVNEGSKVTSVTFEVLTPFNGSPSISVGHDGNQSILASNDDVDLTSMGSYVVTPSHVFAGPGDTEIAVYISDGGASSGSVKVILTYQ
jgi:hypothetical protein